MGDLTPLIEGPIKFREGKKWKQRYACVTRLSPVADSLTLQLWKDQSDCEYHPASKGSIALKEYLGWEAGFTLDKESHTLAIILKEAILVLAFDRRESLMRWQIRITCQFEEGRHFSAHLVQSPSKGKLHPGPVTIHVHNRRFSLTTGIPPKLLHSWNLIDLRRFGCIEGSRFCFEGGSRCCRGEGLHILRMDDPSDLLKAFEMASVGRLEAKKRTTALQSIPNLNNSMSGSSSFASSLDIYSGSSSNLIEHVNDKSIGCEIMKRKSNSRRSINWSGNGSDAGNSSFSCETSSMTLSESSNTSSNSYSTTNRMMDKTKSRGSEYLVNRKTLLEGLRIAATSNGRNSSPEGWTAVQSSKTNTHNLKQFEENSHPMLHYSTPKSLRNVNSEKKCDHAGRISPLPILDIKDHVRWVLDPNTPCSCTQNEISLNMTNYDIPRCFYAQDGRDVSLQNKDLTEKCFVSSEMNSTTNIKTAFGNYDVPSNSNLTVYRKPCGCIISLKPVLNENTETFRSIVPCGSKVKLTGIGKMPVADMRNMKITNEPTNKASPIYASVNKLTRRKKEDLYQSKSVNLYSENNLMYHNYSNITNIADLSQPLSTSIRTLEIGETHYTYAEVDNQIDYVQITPSIQKLQSLENLSIKKEDTTSSLMTMFNDHILHEKSSENVTLHQTSAKDEQGKTVFSFPIPYASLIEEVDWTNRNEANLKLTNRRIPCYATTKVKMRRSTSAPVTTTSHGRSFSSNNVKTSTHRDSNSFSSDSGFSTCSLNNT